MCEECRQTPCHPRCPNSAPLKAAHYCSICGGGIYEGDEYIENLDDEYAHWDCIDGTRELLEFLDCEVKTWKDY